MKLKKILILHEKIGIEHERAANLIGDIFKNHKNVRLIKIPISDLSRSNSIRLISKIRKFLIKHNFLKTENLIINFFTRIIAMPILEVFNIKSSYREIEKIGPDVLICTCDTYSKTLGIYSKQKNIPFYLFLTHLSVFIDFVNPYATHFCYFKETGSAIKSFNFSDVYFSFLVNESTSAGKKFEYLLKYYYEHLIKAYKSNLYKNVIFDKTLRKNTAKVSYLGPFAPKSFFEINNNPEKIMEKYNIKQNIPTVAISGEDLGRKLLIKIIKNILGNYQKHLNLVVLCGNNSKTLSKIMRLKSRITENNINLLPLSSIHDFHKLLLCCDTFISSLSSSAFMESLIKKVPIIVYGNTTSNDKGGSDMIEIYSLGKICKHPNLLIPAIDDMLKKKDWYIKNIRNFLKEYPSTFEEKSNILRESILSNSVNDCKNDSSYKKAVNFGKIV